tara:strand:- start:1446 stop:2240 length:795 start_codon:yes stop_codon:yes gene_type:complete
MELTLDFTQENSGDYVADAGRYTVRLVRDVYAGSPWDSWEGNAPYMKAGDRMGDSIDETSDFPSMRDCFANWTRQQAKLFAAMASRDMGGEKAGSGVADIWRDVIEGYSHPAYPSDIAQEIFDLWTDYLYSHNPLDAYEAAFRVAGYPCLTHTSTGYSQGDYSELLFVWPPALVATFGIPRDLLADDLKGAAHLYDCWAWGDVYGYVIEDSEGEHVDSCFGFCTQSPDLDGPDNGGLIDAALESLPEDWNIDSDIGAGALYAVA